MEEKAYRKEEPAVSQGEVWVLECLPRLASGGMGEGFDKKLGPWRSKVSLVLSSFSILGLLVGLGLSYLLGESCGFRMGLTCLGDGGQNVAPSSWAWRGLGLEEVASSPALTPRQMQ